MTYVYLDLETTGLDPKLCLILELGIAIVDDDLEIMDQRAYTFPWSNYIERYMEKADPVVQEMHTGNHLLAEMMKLQAVGNTMSYNYYKACLEADVLDWFTIVGLQPNTVEMAGDTIHFDRAFLKEHMPVLESWFHYRNWDSSVMKRMVKRWAPAHYQQNLAVFEHEDAHRGLPDALQSIEMTKVARNVMRLSEVSSSATL